MTGVEMIAAERQHQIDEENYTVEHDAGHTDGELAKAAACYAVHAGTGLSGRWGCPPGDPYTGARYKPLGWPFELRFWKPTDDPVRDLAKAGALIAAEIDRLHRAPRGDNA